MPHPASAVGRGVGRDLELDAPRVAENTDALTRRELRRAGESRRPATEIQDAGRDAIGLEIRVVIENAQNAPRLYAEDEPRERDVVTADVHQPAAADLRFVADVVRVVVEVREERMDRPQCADPALSDNPLRASPLRVMAIHKGFHHLELRIFLRRVEQLSGFSRAESDRLLAQRVFSGFERLDRPGHVQMVRRGVVDHFDIGIGQQLFIRAVGFRNAEPACDFIGPGLIARRDGRDLDAFAFQQRRDDLRLREVGRAQYPPSNLVHSVLPFFHGETEGPQGLRDGEIQSLRPSVSLSLHPSVSPSFRLSVSSCKRLPCPYPVVILRPGEVLLVIVNGRLAVGVAGIVILAAELARVPDRLEHCEDAKTALRFGRLEHRVDRRGGLSADVQETDGEEPVAVVYANLPVAARLDRRLFGKEVVDRIGNVLLEPLAMAIEQPLLDLVYERVADDYAEAPISAPNALLAARRREFRQIDAERHDRAKGAPVTRRRIAKEVIPEMPPAERPQ